MLASFRASLLYQIGDLLELARSHDKVYKRGFLKNHSLIFLSHTAHNANYFVRVGLLFLFESSQSAVGLIFCLLPNTAGIVQDCVGLARRVR